MPQLEGVRHRYVEANGLRLHVAEAGSGEPLVLLHGWPQNWWMWRHLIPPLAERYHVLCPDLRGYGWSDAPARGYGKQQMADDVLALLDALELAQVGLVGHDWGGYAGFLLCLGAPARVSRYLVLNTGLPFGRPSPRALASAWRLYYQVLLAAPLLGEWLMRDGRVVRSMARGVRGAWDERDVEVFAGQFREPARARAAVQTYRTFLLNELAVGLAPGGRGRLTTPTLFLHGAEDPVVRPSMLTGGRREALSMRLELVRGVGHFIAEEAPDLVRDRALAFFGS